ncbi:hypothetical protein JCM6882_006068 [Rhodosporidiobolus microsporus]
MASKEASGTIFVGGFSSDTTASSLLAAFSPFGEILDVQLPPDPQDRSKKHRGFGFITFSEAEAATDAIDNMHQNTLPGLTNRGRVLKVNKAKPPKAQQLGGTNKPVWAEEEWIKEHGQDPVLQANLGLQQGQRDGEGEEETGA